MIALARIERTLRSWRLTDQEIDAVRHEASLVKQRDGTSDAKLDKTWAEVEVRAAMEGVILERNFNVGDIVEQNDGLFKIADLSRLRVVVHIYEEDLWSIRALKPEQRIWKIDLKTDPVDNAIEGSFELIGSVIDPSQHTGVVMGWLDNSAGLLSVGQFVTASIALPSDRRLVAIPDTALIEEGDRSMVFVQCDDKGLEFERRKVAVVRRQSGIVLVDSEPTAELQQHGIKRLALGEQVIKSRVLGLGSELNNLRSSTPLVSNTEASNPE